MISDEIDVIERRPLAALTFEHAEGLVVKEFIRLQFVGSQVSLVAKRLYSNMRLEAAGIHEGAERGEQRVGLVAAISQNIRQPSLHAPGRDAENEIREAAK